MCRSSDDSPASSSAAFVAAAAAPTSHTGLNVSLQVVTSNHFFLLSMLCMKKMDDCVDLRKIKSYKSSEKVKTLCHTLCIINAALLIDTTINLTLCVTAFFFLPFFNVGIF